MLNVKRNIYVCFTKLKFIHELIQVVIHAYRFFFSLSSGVKRHCQEVDRSVL